MPVAEPEALLLRGVPLPVLLPGTVLDPGDDRPECAEDEREYSESDRRPSRSKSIWSKLAELCVRVRISLFRPGVPVDESVALLFGLEDRTVVSVGALGLEVAGAPGRGGGMG